jgi:hypothetical protein
MSLDEWGTIAEIVGALAVVITLVYLAIQVKHSKESLDANTKAIRGQSISDVTRNVHDQMQMLAQGHDMTEWFGKFVTGETLDSKDALLTDAFLSAIFMARQNEFLQWQQGLLDETVFKSLHQNTGGITKDEACTPPNLLSSWTNYAAKCRPMNWKNSNMLFDWRKSKKSTCDAVVETAATGDNKG